MDFAKLLKVLFALGLGAASAGVMAVLDFVRAQPVDFTSFEGLVVAVVLAAVARGLGWVVGKIPKPE